MCDILKISRGMVYYEFKTRVKESIIDNTVIQIFRKSKNNYGTRKIKVELEKLGFKLSRKFISNIMKRYSLVSNYTVKQFKIHKSKFNEEKVSNIVERNFNNRKLLEVVVSDLTYVSVGGKWSYICVLLDLFNREIIGFSSGSKKDAKLVEKAFLSLRVPLSRIEIFHTDRGSEFKNSIIDNILNKYMIKRSLSKKGSPYDNAVAEATYKIIKTEFVNSNSFENEEQLALGLFEYVNWYNNIRIHSSLNYLTPVDFKKSVREKVV